MSNGSLHINIPNSKIIINTPSDEIAVIVFNNIYLTPVSEISTFACNCIKSSQHDLSNESGLIVITVMGLIQEHIAKMAPPVDMASAIKSIRIFDQFAHDLHVHESIEDLFDIHKFATLLLRTNWKIYDTSFWRRGGYYLSI